MEVTLENCRKAIDAYEDQSVFIQGEKGALIYNFLKAVKLELETPRLDTFVTNPKPEGK